MSVPMSKRGGMQMVSSYKKQLDPAFLKWYLREFRNPRMVYLHWSAGMRWTNFRDYHVVVGCDQHGTPFVERNAPLTQDLHEHTYQRNTGSLAVCVASMYGATSEDLGSQQPTVEQLVRFVSETRQICCNLRIPVANVMTHAEAADNVDGANGLDFYGPANGCERWDFHCYIDPKTLKLAPPSGGRKAGHEYFPDWLRGQIALQIQKATEKYWKA